MTEAEIDALFEQTQPIGNALNAVYQAELIVAAAATSIPATVRARLDAVIRDLTDDKDTP